MKPAPESLEDLVYRATLSEGDPAIRAGSPWVTIPVTLVLLGLMGMLVILAGRPAGTSQAVFQTVDVVLQEGPERPAQAPAPRAPAPGPRPEAPAPAPSAAPAPATQPKELPPPAGPGAEAVPDQAPQTLPTEDNSRRYGTGAGPGGAPGGAARGAGSGAGEGPGAGGHGPPGIVDLDLTEVQETYRPPPPAYPIQAQMARIQGTVVVQVLVGVDGVPVSAQALTGPPKLRATAEAHALAWRFRPYLRNGAAMPSRFTITVHFKL